MLLLVLRHARAADRNPDQFPDDDLRPLLPKGHRQGRAVGRFLRRRNLCPDLVLTSPRLRCLQTTDALLEGLGQRPGCWVEPGLADLTSAIAETLLQNHRSIATLLWCGHEPELGAVVSYLVGGAPSTLLPLRKAGIAGIDLDPLRPRDGRLRFLIDPGILHSSWNP